MAAVQMLVVFIVVGFWIAVAAAAVWALITLNRIANTLLDISAKLDQLLNTGPRV
jgi:hypothetical protein